MEQLELLNVGLKHFLFIGAVMFSLGTYTVLSRRNAVGVLIGVELVLNAANINLVAFAHYTTGGLEGHVFALFVIVIAAAEAAIALAIVLSIFQNFKTIDATKIDVMRN